MYTYMQEMTTKHEYCVSKELTCLVAIVSVLVNQQMSS